MTERVKPLTSGLVLVADDDAEVRRVLGRWLDKAGYDVELCPDGPSCLDRLSESLPDAVCLDLEMPRLGGLETLARIRARHRFLPVLILTGDASVESAVTAMKRGAFDYLTKPLDYTHLVTRIGNAVERNRMALRLSQLEREVEGRGFPEIVGSSAKMKALFRKMDRVAASDITVLVTGESGTGKELVARAIHTNSRRRDGAFVALNCAAIPETLQESELFGHEKGAFTGASETRPGRFEQAASGTLFLDEVGELSLPLQAKLLRVLQEKRFHRVGGSLEIYSDFRLIAATHRDLATEVPRGAFREDLFFRIAVFELVVPPLRERREDIPELVSHVFEELGADASDALMPEMLERLMAYDWPGNVRELRNVLESAFVLSDGGVITEAELPPRLKDAVAAAERSRLQSAEAPAAASLSSPHSGIGAGFPREIPLLPLAELERLAIERAIVAQDGNVSEACRVLGISRNTLYRKMKKFGLKSRRTLGLEKV